jgi:hypothetical protein
MNEFLDLVEFHRIHLSTTVFYAEGGQVHVSSQVDGQQTIKTDFSQKAMAIYLGRVVT